MDPYGSGRSGGVGTLGLVVLDCPDPLALARFYSELTGVEVHPESGAQWAELRGPEPQLAFQQAENYTPPAWPDGAPQQVHLDVYVADFGPAHDAVVALGAQPLDPADPPPSQGKRGFRVYADPVGHPFCLCLRGS